MLFSLETARTICWNVYISCSHFIVALLEGSRGSEREMKSARCEIKWNEEKNGILASWNYFWVVVRLHFIVVFVLCSWFRILFCHLTSSASRLSLSLSRFIHYICFSIVHITLSKDINGDKWKIIRFICMYSMCTRNYGNDILFICWTKRQTTKKQRQPTTDNAHCTHTNIVCKRSIAKLFSEKTETGIFIKIQLV